MLAIRGSDGASPSRHAASWPSYFPDRDLQHINNRLAGDFNLVIFQASHIDAAVANDVERMLFLQPLDTNGHFCGYSVHSQVGAEKTVAIAGNH